MPTLLHRDCSDDSRRRINLTARRHGPDDPGCLVSHGHREKVMQMKTCLRQEVSMRPISFNRHRLPPDTIRLAVWLFVRFTTSSRDVEEMLRTEH